MCIGYLWYCSCFVTKTSDAQGWTLRFVLYVPDLKCFDFLNEKIPYGHTVIQAYNLKPKINKTINKKYFFLQHNTLKKTRQKTIA